MTEDNRRWSEDNGIWQYKDYDERITVSSYATVSCTAKGVQYKTSYTLYAEVHSDAIFPHVRRKHPPTPRKGAFSDYVIRWGDIDPDGGWKYELDQSSLSATVTADGTCPPTGKTHETSSEALIHPNDLIIVCDHCDDNGCSLCSDHRE